ncbi:MAG: hypothetical protein ABL953_07360 [Ilumatobacteraceae bacterium]
MTLDDELRKRLKEAADRAGAGANPAALTPSAASTSPAAVLPMKLLAGLGAFGLIVGGALGLTALKPADDNTGIGVTVEVQQYSLYDCPDGAPTGIAYPGDRVYVTGRDESGSWLEVRDPRNQGSTLWVPSAAVNPDAVIEVPVHDCTDEVELIAVEAETTTTTVVETTTTTLPLDTQKPVVVVAKGSPNPDEIWGINPDNCVDQSTITVQAADNVGVTQVRGTYAAGLPGSPLVFVHGAGNTWTATFGPFAGVPSPYRDVVISIVARDAAGNNSTATTATVGVWGSGDCLF